jgi:inositol oxygenase
MKEKDNITLEWVKRFNPYDLYSKKNAIVEVEKVKDYYLELISEFLPKEIVW